MLGHGIPRKGNRSRSGFFGPSSLPFANLQWLIIRISSHTSLAIIEDDHHFDEPELTDEDI
jgi:hypothetical protein